MTSPELYLHLTNVHFLRILMNGLSRDYSLRLLFLLLSTNSIIFTTFTFIMPKLFVNAFNELFCEAMAGHIF